MIEETTAAETTAAETTAAETTAAETTAAETTAAETTAAPLPSDTTIRESRKAAKAAANQARLLEIRQLLEGKSSDEIVALIKDAYSKLASVIDSFDLSLEEIQATEDKLKAKLVELRSTTNPAAPEEHKEAIKGFKSEKVALKVERNSLSKQHKTQTRQARRYLHDLISQL